MSHLQAPALRARAKMAREKGVRDRHIAVAYEGRACRHAAIRGDRTALAAALKPCALERRFSRRCRREGLEAQLGRRAMPREQIVEPRSATLGLVGSGHEVNGSVGVTVVRLPV